MDHRPKRRSENYKASRRTYRRISNFGVRKTLDKTQDILIIREKMNKWASSKLKTSTPQKIPLRK